MVDFKVFDDNLFLLEEIFSKNTIDEKLERLKSIYTNTEESWLRNLEYFQNSEVKYILICEAPPYSETEVPIFFYNQCKSNFHKTIWKTFFDDNINDYTQKEIYQKFAQKGFLLIDNIPFPMKYFTIHRKKEAYFQLVKSSLEWALKKIFNNKIKLSKDLKIAFGFKINAIQFIKATNGKIDFKGNILKFDESNIGANSSGFTSFKKLKNIYFDDFQDYRYYNGEIENPFCKNGDFVMDFDNPKSLFWYYEKHFNESENDDKDYSKFISNLINNKLSEYNRNEQELWEMYYHNSIK